VAMHNSAHPGQALKELYLDPLGLTTTQAAKKVWEFLAKRSRIS